MQRAKHFIHAFMERIPVRPAIVFLVFGLQLKGGFWPSCSGSNMRSLRSEWEPDASAD